MDNSKEIILDELNEQSHPEHVEHVIFWALEHYAKRGEGTWGETIAYTIVERIKESEQANKVTDSEYLTHDLLPQGKTKINYKKGY